MSSRRFKQCDYCVKSGMVRTSHPLSQDSLEEDSGSSSNQTVLMECAGCGMERHLLLDIARKEVLE